MLFIVLPHAVTKHNYESKINCFLHQRSTLQGLFFLVDFLKVVATWIQCSYWAVQKISSSLIPALVCIDSLLDSTPWQQLCPIVKVQIQTFIYRPSHSNIYAKYQGVNYKRNPTSGKFCPKLFNLIGWFGSGDRFTSPGDILVKTSHDRDLQ